MPGTETISTDLGAFLELAGKRSWTNRIATLTQAAKSGQKRARQALMQRYMAEITLERVRREELDAQPGTPGGAVVALACQAGRTYAGLSRDGRARMRNAVRAGLTGEGTLIPVLHLVRTATMQAARGFAVSYAGWDDEAPFDLMIHRDGIEAEIACDVISAEEGRDVRRGAWVDLVDGIDPDLQTWLAAHPGRYLLKLTLPQGLCRGDEPGCDLAALHGRIRSMLKDSRRADQDEAAVLRLDPLMLAAAQADELGLMSSLRREFGPEAHLAVTASGSGVLVLAARAGREDEVAVALRRRMAAVAPARLTGTRPGILAMFVEDTDRGEWRKLRDKLELEGEARQFLTHDIARCVVAVTCASRIELFADMAGPANSEMRFRNPSHPAAKLAALAPAVISTD